IIQEDINTAENILVEIKKMLTNPAVRADLGMDNIDELNNLHGEINQHIDANRQTYINKIVEEIRNIRENYPDEIQQLDEGEDIDVNTIYDELSEQIIQIEKLN